QAKLLADKSGLVHFDTGNYIREILYNPSFKKNKIIQKEKLLNEAGKLNTPSWVLKIIVEKVRKIEKLKEGVVFSGSPRTMFEAFGNGKNKGLIKILEEFYGKKNIFIFVLNISEKESIKRNSKRIVCSICRTPLLSQKSEVPPQARLAKGDKCQMSDCPFCGGRLKSRFDDKKEIIPERLKEYKLRTFPIIEELKRRKYKVLDIDGRPLPYKIHNKILSFI
ncbi:nucleoside monophosphate kinase, partial [Candidatus Wolfebacteria bacterium]|nr:nucleoside monophosphate kinase [Candidatus Wolfebacteria bacterium]